jgi:hypothetical protein
VGYLDDRLFVPPSVGSSGGALPWTMEPARERAAIDLDAGVAG